MYEYPLAEHGYVAHSRWPEAQRDLISDPGTSNLEEDAGKLKHGEGQEAAAFSYVDFNRTAFLWLKS